MPDRVFTSEQRDELRMVMLEAGFPLIKEYGVTHTTISKITDKAGIATLPEAYGENDTSKVVIPLVKKIGADDED